MNAELEMNVADVAIKGFFLGCGVGGGGGGVVYINCTYV